jgi:predicted phosphoribosyltransferase
MNFTDRTTLGVTLADRLKQLHSKDAVIVCLQESSLMTCISMASKLHAWVFPLIYEPVYTPDHAHRLLGAFDQDGIFCHYHVGPVDELKSSDEDTDIIESSKKEAMKVIHAKSASYDMELNKHSLDGRDTILVADVIISPLPLLVAQQYLEPVTPKSWTSVAGNASPIAAQLLRMSAVKSEILDILSGVVSDEDRYFLHADTQSLKQKHTLTRHINAYWQ